MYYIYVLISIKDRKLYIGYTDNLKRRYQEHLTGKVDSTRSRRPLELVYYEAFKYEMDARRQEVIYKTGQGRRILKLRLKNVYSKIVGEVA
jgi:putative endonuclease